MTTLIYSIANCYEEVQLEADPLIIAELQRLKEIQELHGYKPMWIYHRLIENCPDVGLLELRQCAELLGYRPGWAWFKWQELQQQPQLQSA